VLVTWKQAEDRVRENQVGLIGRATAAVDHAVAPAMPVGARVAAVRRSLAVEAVQVAFQHFERLPLRLWQRWAASPVHYALDTCTAMATSETAWKCSDR